MAFRFLSARQNHQCCLVRRVPRCIYRFFRISVSSFGVKEIKVCFTETQTSLSGSGILNWLQGIVDAVVEIRRLFLTISTLVRRRPVAVSKFNTSIVAALQASSICSRVSRAF